MSLADKSSTLQIKPWPEADRLFHADPRWLGGDDAFSIDLGNGKVLWLFGDSFVTPKSGGNRRDATMVRNSVAFQSGYDPVTAKMKFYWREAGGLPGSFFPEDGDVWYWPGHGARLNDGLLMFMMKVRSGQKTLGLVEFDFDVFGWEAVLVRNPDDDPLDWTLEWLHPPQNSFGAIVGAASVTCHDGWLYAFGATNPRFHEIYALRWPEALAAIGDLGKPQWWCGEDRGWVYQEKLSKQPQAIFDKGQNELTIHHDTHSDSFLAIHTRGLVTKAHIVMRWSNELTGPWSEPKEIYTPVESGRDRVTIYAAKSQPILTGAQYILTYVVNHLDVDTVRGDESLYYPHFLKGQRV